MWSFWFISKQSSIPQKLYHSVTGRYLAEFGQQTELVPPFLYWIEDHVACRIFPSRGFQNTLPIVHVSKTFRFLSVFLKPVRPIDTIHAQKLRVLISKYFFLTNYNITRDIFLPPVQRYVPFFHQWRVYNSVLIPSRIPSLQPTFYKYVWLMVNDKGATNNAVLQIPFDTLFRGFNFLPARQSNHYNPSRIRTLLHIMYTEKTLM